jgi:hypothetical protein
MDFEVVRPVKDGEMRSDTNWNVTPVRNPRQNKWIARPVGKEGPEIMVCFDDVLLSQ